jgi:hypothetical protein
MAAVVIRHKVGDFDTWMKGHSEREAAVEQVASSFRTFRDVDDPNSIVLVAEDVDLDKFEALTSNPEIQAQMEKHTVVQPVLLSVEVDL